MPTRRRQIGWTPRIFKGTVGEQPKLDCRFFMTPSGAEPVRAWLKSLPVLARQEIGSDIRKVQWRWPIGLPLVDGIGQGLYEVRTMMDGDIFRTFFCVDAGVMWLLHGLMKKTQKTSRADLMLARKRQHQLEVSK
jgi:phage-related protein